MEDYNKIKKVLALGFMHFLDENRTEGKMCLSNGECADIEKAFNEQDWPKLVRYLDKYRKSEDERMIRKIEMFLSAYGADYFSNDEWREIEDWLEKQKESLHLSETCKENADSFTDEHPNIIYTEMGEEFAKQKERKPSNGIYWHAIKNGERLPCPSYIWTTAFEKYSDSFEGRLVPNIENVKVGADTWYLPVEDVRDLPREGVDQKPRDWGDADKEMSHPLFVKGFETGREVERIYSEQKPLVPMPHKGNDGNPYDMGVSEAQEYAINRGFGTPLNDGEVFVDERHITQTIGNILRWADEHPKEQKPAWSEEDEQIRNAILGFLNPDKGGTKYSSYAELVEWSNWLKSLRPQLKQEWSGEDEDNLGKLHRLLVICQGEKKFIPSDEYDKLDKWLKSLKNRGNYPKSNTNSPSWKPSEQKEQNQDKWSKKDKKILQSLHHIMNCADAQNAVKRDGLSVEDVCDFLFSIEPHWKPSEEQMIALNKVVNGEVLLTTQHKSIESLYNDLKKL